jgi:hypothetical protein
MMTPGCRECRLIVLTAIVWGRAAGMASAQATDQGSMTTPSWEQVKARLPVGDVVYVTDTTGATIKGQLAALTDDALQVDIGANVRRVPATEVRRIQWQRPDSPLTGVLIGAAVGAIPGIYYLAVDPNECNGMCPEEYALIAIGALAGGVIDHAIKRRVTVYAAGVSSDRATSITVGPLVTRERKGVQVAVKF